MSDEDEKFKTVLDRACASPDLSSDYVPVVDAEETYYCVHGFLDKCPECWPARVPLSRPSKDEAAAAIRDVVVRDQGTWQKDDGGSSAGGS
jgi:hypothetical protein